MLQNHAGLLKSVLGRKRNRTARRTIIGILVSVILECVNVPPAIAHAEESFPDDVTAFFHDAKMCQYLAGEWDSSLPRKRKNELSAEMNEACSTIYKRQEYLKRKYIRNKTIMRKLNAYEFS